ncbi:MAG: hypothetical protein RR161_04010 [Bacilli bacterium]
MLQSLEILNGELSPKYDIYNNIYSVKVEKNITSLEINYVINETDTINIIGNNNFTDGENIVLIEVFNGTSLTSYTLNVLKETSQVINNYNEIINPVEVKKELPIYVAPFIASFAFLIILFTFWLLFKKGKH